VDWIGTIDKRTDTPRFLELVGSADVGCLPSRAEAGGIALREYRALGLVMFGSGVGGAAEYLREGPSIVIAPDAGEGVIAERLLDLEADGERRRDWREQAWSDRRSALWPASVDRLLTFWPRTRIRPTAGRRKDAVPPRRASAGVTAIPDAGIDPPCASGAPAIVVYDHCSPVQVAALERARHRLAAAGYCLVPVELFGGPSAPRRTATTDPRPPGWICLSPNRGGVSRWAWRERTRAFVRLAGVVRRLKPAVIVLNGWFEPVSWWMVAARPWLDARVALVSDSTLADRRRLALIEGLKRRFLRRVDAVFTAGTRQRQYLESLGVAASQVSLGCDVVDNARFLQIDRRSVTDGPPAIIGTAARLVPQKNLVTALDGYARVVGRGGVPPLRWRIAGEGPLEATLKARARSLGAPVEFCGHLPYERMQAFYAGLDLYWQPSRSEAWGLSVNEAMAAGLPVLASTCCGCVDDLVTPDAGWTHGPGLPEIEEGLHRAVAGRAEWPARGARAREVIARWDLDRFANGLADTVRRADRDATRPALNLTSAGT
jgi:glycosyltransferase involved in cell wall biosynthesis